MLKATATTPEPGYVGVDSFAYRVPDGIETSQAAIVKIEVFNTDAAAAADTYFVEPGETLEVSGAGVLFNDVDQDGDALTVSLAEGVRHGELELRSDGSFVYAPKPGFQGADRFVYQVSDGSKTQKQTAHLHVGSPTAAPLAANDFYTVAHDRTLAVGYVEGALANDIYPTEDWLDARLLSEPKNGALEFFQDGSFIYTPNAGFTGTDSFTYAASDGASASDPDTVSIQVVNHAPSATNAAYDLLHDETLEVFSAEMRQLVSDNEQDELTFRVVSEPSHGQLTFQSDGSFVYTPELGFVGSDSFSYVVNDGLADSEPAEILLDVTNQAPLVKNLSRQTQHGETLESGGAGVLAWAADPDGDLLTAHVVEPPIHGTLTLSEEGAFTYTPNAGFSGRDSFTYVASDGVTDSSPGVVAIDVLNQAPVVMDAFHQVHHRDSLRRFWEAMDLDGDDLTYKITTPPAHGSVTIEGDQYIYRPQPGYTGEDVFTFLASDGVSNSEEASVTIRVTNTNPQALDLTYSIHSGGSVAMGAPGLLGEA